VHKLTIVNRSKIRPDVLKIMDTYLNVRPKFIESFYKKEGKKEFDYESLMQKVMEGNERSFKGEDMSDFLTKDEQLFIAKFLRFSGESGSNYLQKKYPINKNVKLEPIHADGVPAEWQIVPGAKEERVLLYFHGGGFILGSVNGHRLSTVLLGMVTKMRVLSVDYRLAPEHPHPAPLEDSTTVYKWLLSEGFKAKNIIIAGDSAGGNLTLTTLLKLKEDGISMPAGAFCLSPRTLYEIENTSFLKNAETDVFLGDSGLFWWSEAHLSGTDPHDPLVTPIYGNLKGLPSLLLQVSNSEMLYDDSVLFVEKAKAAGVDASLEEWDDMMHVFQYFGLPESKKALDNIGKFVQRLFK